VSVSNASSPEKSTWLPAQSATVTGPPTIRFCSSTTVAISRHIPLATVSGLRRTLREIADRMDRDRDVLFLVLSSHGSEEPAISVSNRSLPLKQLTAGDLAEALKASGIRWKVIVISACHSGAFSRRAPGEIRIPTAWFVSRDSETLKLLIIK
jgi:Peptidase C13 family